MFTEHPLSVDVCWEPEGTVVGRQPWLSLLDDRAQWRRQLYIKDQPRGAGDPSVYRWMNICYIECHGNAGSGTVSSLRWNAAACMSFDNRAKGNKPGPTG